MFTCAASFIRDDSHQQCFSALPAVCVFILIIFFDVCLSLTLKKNFLIMSPSPSFGSEEQEVGQPPDSAPSSSLVSAFLDKAYQLMSEIKDSGVFMDQCAADLEDCSKSIENCLQDINRMLLEQKFEQEVLDKYQELQSLFWNQVEIIKKRDLRVELIHSKFMEEVKHIYSIFLEAELSVEQALDLLPAVSSLGLTSLVVKTAAILMNALSMTNCILIFQAASRCQIDNLVDASRHMVCKNFNEVSKTCMAFCNLSLEELSIFLFSDSVHATEEQIFEAIERWIEADPSGRRGLISQLLPAVRVHKCSFRFLRQVRSHFLVQGDQKFMSAVKDRIQKLSSGGLRKDSFGEKDVPRFGRNVLSVIGGHNGVETPTQGTDLPTLPEPIM